MFDFLNVPVQLADVALAASQFGIILIIVRSIYRLTIHPYAKYPGPILAKLTTLYGVYYAYTGDMHLDIERCHKKYGTFVRYGPNALLTNSPAGFHDIYGQMKKVKKSESYRVHGPGNLIGIRDKKEYAKKKKIFQQGFSDTAVREYEPKVIQEINTFCEKISENESFEKGLGGWSSVKNMRLWCNYLTTDVVSKVVFTTSWDLLTSAKNRTVTETMSTIVHLIGVLHQSPLLYFHKLCALILLPNLAWSIPSLRKHTIEIMESSRIIREKNPLIKDVFGQYISAKDPDSGELALKYFDVVINSSNFIVAGSDTTSSALSATFFYLSRNSDAYSKVAYEVRSMFPSAKEIRVGPALNGCVYLRAAINEAMRLSPSVAQPLWRQTERGGCFIDGQFIPGGLNVGSGLYSLHHNPIAFQDPFNYVIERWIVRAGDQNEVEQQKERIKEMSKSFAPFSVGPRQCIAKNFALMELMLAMAYVFWRFDFKSADGQDGRIGEGATQMGRDRGRTGEFQMKSYFTSHMKGPMVRFKKREI